MRLVEYRITMPIDVESYGRGYRYATVENSKLETGGGQGIIVEKNEPFKLDKPLFKTYDQGQFTHKVYHVDQKVGRLWRSVLPKAALHADEDAWNAHPYCKTVLSNEAFFGDKAEVEILSLHLADNGKSDNVFELSEKDLKKREVVELDILDDEHMLAEDKKQLDMSEYTNSCTKHALNTLAVIRMCVYKLVRVRCDVFGLQRFVESRVIGVYPRTFKRIHRQVMIWHVKWCDLTKDEIFELEKVQFEKINESFKTGKMVGTTNIE